MLDFGGPHAQRPLAGLYGLGDPISFIADENNYLTIAKVSIATLAGILVAIAFA